MAGEYDPNSPPVLPGFYARIRDSVAAVAQGGDLGIVAVPVVHNWGPIAEFVSVRNQTEFEAVFGDSDTDASFAVLGALTGDTDNGGASEVLVYRMDVTGHAKAAITLDNTSAANAITLTAKHEGTFGNGITVTTRENPANAAEDQLLVYVNTSLKETFTYTAADIQELVDAVNDATTGSAFLDASLDADGTALDDVTSQPLTGGLNGSAVAGDHTTAQTAMEGQTFNLVVVPNLTDSGILASYHAWVANLNVTIKRVMMVTGGAAAESLNDAITRSGLTSDNENFVNLGLNEFEDVDAVVHSSAEMVGYVAGMIAGAGVTKNITFNRVAGFSLVDRPSIAEKEQAVANGVLLFDEDDRGIKVIREKTTYTDDTPEKTFATFSSIKNVRVIHKIEGDLTVITEDEWIGAVQNTPTTRSNYVGMVLGFLRDLEDLGVLEPGSSEVEIDETQDNTGDAIYVILRYGNQGIIEQVLAIGEIV